MPRPGAKAGAGAAAGAGGRVSVGKDVLRSPGCLPPKGLAPPPPVARGQQGGTEAKLGSQADLSGKPSPACLSSDPWKVT